MVYFREGHLPLGKLGGLIRHVTLLILIRKFQTDMFNITFLGEAETVIRLAIKFGLVMRLSKSDSILAYCFIFQNSFYKNTFLSI